MSAAPDLAAFFRSVRQTVFGGHLTQPQVEGMQALIRVWDTHYPNEDKRWLAYCLATAAHETALTMQPVAEDGRGEHHPYGVPDATTGQTYYGRGYVQLTWKPNYFRMGQFLELDLVNYPDLALEPGPAAYILFGGMIRGAFTGARLRDYFNDRANDFINARRIVNGLDCCYSIGAKHNGFMVALTGTALPVAPARMDE